MDHLLLGLAYLLVTYGHMVDTVGTRHVILKHPRILSDLRLRLVHDLTHARGGVQAKGRAVRTMAGRSGLSDVMVNTSRGARDDVLHDGFI